jgi:hypothetical protein
MLTGTMIRKAISKRLIRIVFLVLTTQHFWPRIEKRKKTLRTYSVNTKKSCKRRFPREKNVIMDTHSQSFGICHKLTKIKVINQAKVLSVNVELQ